MECLKKLSLISLQLEVTDPPVLHLQRDDVTALMGKRDFPFALTLAVAYDMDGDQDWARALFAQAIEKPGEDFVQAFQLFRSISTALCAEVVRLYKERSGAEGMKDRMVKFLMAVPNLVDRYKIAKELAFTEEIDSMREVNPMVCEWCEKALT
jgi:spatacsin